MPRCRRRDGARGRRRLLMASSLSRANYMDWTDAALRKRAGSQEKMVLSYLLVIELPLGRRGLQSKRAASSNQGSQWMMGKL